MLLNLLPRIVSVYLSIRFAWLLLESWKTYTHTRAYIRGILKVSAVLSEAWVLIELEPRLSRGTKLFATYANSISTADVTRNLHSATTRPRYFNFQTRTRRTERDEIMGWADIYRGTSDGEGEIRRCRSVLLSFRNGMDKGMRYYRTIFPFASLIVTRVFPISSLLLSESTDE